MKAMGKSGQALKQVLGNYNISQNKLATVMGIRRSVIYRWVRELADPTGDKMPRSRRPYKKSIPTQQQLLCAGIWENI
jgi:transposase